MTQRPRPRSPRNEEGESSMRESRVGSRGAGEAGFALVLAILSLMLLTFLGLTLAATTSTELQIATNYRWSQQALYNAEAGVEAGKALLSTMNWSSIVWAPRTASPWTGLTNPTGIGAVAPFSRNDQWGSPTRNFESWQCDSKYNGVGYGVILDDGTAAAPYQNKDVVFGRQLNGAFTLWVRRPLNFRADGRLEDFSANNDTLILISEGVAPFVGGAITTGIGAANRAVRTIEVTLSRQPAVAGGTCGNRGGQTGAGSLGAGHDPCSTLTGGAAVTNALGGAVTGTGAELNANQ